MACHPGFFAFMAVADGSGVNDAEEWARVAYKGGSEVVSNEFALVRPIFLEALRFEEGDA